MRRLVSALVLVFALPAAASAQSATRLEERTFEFSSGLSLQRAPLPSLYSAFPGLHVEGRWLASRHLWISGLVNGTFGVHNEDPENGEEVMMLGVGPGIGGYTDVSSQVSLYGGAQLEWVQAWNWPRRDGGRETVRDGFRATPQLGAAWWIGDPWGHPMAVEARLGRSVYWIGDTFSNGWTGSLSVTGVLFPDPGRIQE